MKSFMKKTAAVGLALILVLALAVPALADESTWPADIREVADEDYTGKTVILASNDVHGAIDGYAAMAKLKEDLEAKGAEVLMVDAGDYIQGNAYVNTSDGESAIRMMNAAGYTVATVGNHEYDYGYDTMMKILGEAEFPIICADAFKDGKPIFDSTFMYETKDGTKIGFFGLDTPETKTKSNPKLTEGVEFLSGQELYDCAQEQVDALRKDGADIVIALTHLGVSDESESSGNRSVDVYNHTNGIDFIIDGHSHTVMTSGQNQEPIQSTGTKFANISVLILDKDQITDHYLTPVEGIAEDDRVEEIAKEIEAKVDAEYGEVFAKSEVLFEGAREKNRSQETNNGDLITDALLWFAEQNPQLFSVKQDHVIAWENGGGIRDQIAEGDISKKDIQNVYPFGDTIGIVTVKGSDILEALEASTFCTPELLGGFPQTAGIEWTLDTDKEYDAGELYPDSTYYKPNSIQRVSIQSVHGQPFDPDATYAVVCNDFVAAGGDSCYVFGAKDDYDTGISFEDTLINYIKEDQKGVLTKDKYGDIRGNLTILGTGKGSQSSDASGGGTSGGSGSASGGTYVVAFGDCLWTIAEKQYGDGMKWADIYYANAGTLADPSMIYPGQVLVLPAA